MKVYGETIFDIAYLLIAICVGVYLLVKSQNKGQKLMGIATLVLGLGDSFHLVPRVLDYFVDKDFSMALGVGKLVTSITMTIFYICMYYIYLNTYEVKENKKITISVWVLAITRIVLCLFPQNNWFTNNSPLNWGIIRNVPFLILGALIVVLYFKQRKEVKSFKNIWLFVTLSFLFYIPVVVGASTISMLGMFMLPKTVCYILIILMFRKNIKITERN